MPTALRTKPFGGPSMLSVRCEPTSVSSYFLIGFNSVKESARDAAVRNGARSNPETGLVHASTGRIFVSDPEAEDVR